MNDELTKEIEEIEAMKTRIRNRAKESFILWLQGEIEGMKGVEATSEGVNKLGDMIWESWYGDSSDGGARMLPRRESHNEGRV